MDEASTWEHLPANEHKFVWDEAEGKFWRDFNAKQEALHSEKEREYQLALTDAKFELGKLDGKRNELTKVRERLALELSNLDKELANVVTECNGRSDMIFAMEQKYRHDEQDFLQQREKVTETMIRWFQEKRDAAAKAQGDAGDDQTVNKIADAPRETTDSDATEMEGVEYWNELPQRPAVVTRQVAAKTPIAPIAPSSSLKGILQEPVEALVDLVDADGRVIGPINKTEPWNQWVKAILGLPIKRSVKIRRGRKFTTDHLAGIYEHTEAKGVKWLSCMIQAIGDIQAQRCISCDKNQGAFDDCIIIGGPLFQKCGNCEWNRQGCHGAALRKGGGSGESPVADDNIPSAETPREEEQQQQQQPGEEEEAPKDMPNGNGSSRLTADGTAEEADSPPPREDDDIKGRIWTNTPREAPKEVEEDEVVPDRFHDRYDNQGQEMAQQIQTRKQQATEEALAVAAGVAEAVSARSVQSDEVKPTITERRGLPTSRPAFYQTEQLLNPKDRPESRAYPYNTGFTPANVPSRPSSQDLNTPTPRSMEASPQPSDNADEPALPKITRETLTLRHNGKVYTHPEIIEGVPLEKIDPSHPYWDPKWPDIRGLIETPLNQWREKHQQAMESKDKGVDKASTRFQLGRQVNRGLKILEFLDEGEISPYQLLSKKYTTSGKGSITSYDTLFRLCETLSELGKYGLDIHPPGVDAIIHNFYNDPKLAALRTKSGFKNIGRPSGVKASRRSGAPSNDTPYSQSQQQKKRKTYYSNSGAPGDHDRSSTDLTSEGGNDGTTMAPESPTSGGPIIKRARTLSPSIRPYRTLVDDTEDFTDTDLWSGAPITQNDFRVDQIKSRLYTSSPRVTQRVLKAHLIMSDRNTQISSLDGRPRGDVLVSFRRERTLRRLIRVLGSMGVRTIEGSQEELLHRWAIMQSEQLSERDEELAGEDHRRPASSSQLPVAY
ncbi:hypothetical protein TrVGV298_006799 [Trichoderma virens]|nr:hypothetical protein TrVGV298_006799 [Trichoderma virens]